MSHFTYTLYTKTKISARKFKGLSQISIYVNSSENFYLPVVFLMFDNISRKGIIFGRVIIKKVVNCQRKIRGRFAIEIILEKS